jgi:hypothetical protein
MAVSSPAARPGVGYSGFGSPRCSYGTVGLAPAFGAEINILGLKIDTEKAAKTVQDVQSTYQTIKGAGEEPIQSSPTSTQGGTMTRDGSAPRVRTGGVSTSQYPTKSHYVSDPSSPGYNPSSSLYNPALDPSGGSSALALQGKSWTETLTSPKVLLGIGLVAGAFFLARQQKLI